MFVKRFRRGVLFAALHIGVLVRCTKKNEEEKNIVFVDTREGLSGKTILATYDQRSEIEETHRQMKCFQDPEKLPSKKYIHVVFRIIMGTIAYNLFNLFLNSKKCATIEDYALKTHRQRRRSIDRNPDIIIYTGDTYAILKNLDLIDLILTLKKEYPDEAEENLKRINKLRMSA